MGKILRRADVVKATGLSSTTVWRLERDGKFPARRKISDGLVGWVESEVFKWMDERQPVIRGNTKNVDTESRRGRKMVFK